MLRPSTLLRRESAQNAAGHRKAIGAGRPGWERLSPEGRAESARGEGGEAEGVRRAAEGGTVLPIREPQALSPGVHVSPRVGLTRRKAGEPRRSRWGL